VLPQTLDQSGPINIVRPEWVIINNCGGYPANSVGLAHRDPRIFGWAPGVSVRYSLPMGGPEHEVQFGSSVGRTLLPWIFIEITDVAVSSFLLLSCRVLKSAVAKC
ncbi:hypothetical protein XELAEV_18038337mg, partial [Xenopus laevis]